MKLLYILAVLGTCCAGATIARVDCPTGQAGGDGYLSAACPGYPFDISPATASVQTHQPIWPGGATDFSEFGPGVWTRKAPTSGFVLLQSVASLEADFALVLTLPGGGSGYFIPCLQASGVFLASASFAGVTVTGSSPNNCSPIPPMAAGLPFDSGVTQILHGVFSAATRPLYGGGDTAYAFLTGFVVYDAQGNLMNCCAQMRLDVIPEPGTMALMVAGLACVALFGARRGCR